MSIELHGPAWAWVLFFIGWFGAVPFLRGFMEELFKGWRQRRRRPR